MFNQKNILRLEPPWPPLQHATWRSHSGLERLNMHLDTRNGFSDPKKLWKDISHGRITKFLEQICRPPRDFWLLPLIKIGRNGFDFEVWTTQNYNFLWLKRHRTQDRFVSFIKTTIHDLWSNLVNYPYKTLKCKRNLLCIVRWGIGPIFWKVIEGTPDIRKVKRSILQTSGKISR